MCTGFKNVRGKDSLFHIFYIQCDDKAQAEPHELKHIKNSVSSAALETSSFIQTTERISFRGASSSLRTRSCINVMTIASCPQRDRNVSSFDLSGFNLRPGLLSLSWICSFLLYLSPLISSLFFFFFRFVHPSSFLTDVSVSEISLEKRRELVEKPKPPVAPSNLRTWLRALCVISVTLASVISRGT